MLAIALMQAAADSTAAATDGGILTLQNAVWAAVTGVVGIVSWFTARRGKKG